MILNQETSPSAYTNLATLHIGIQTIKDTVSLQRNSNMNGITCVKTKQKKKK